MTYGSNLMAYVAKWLPKCGNFGDHVDGFTQLIPWDLESFLLPVIKFLKKVTPVSIWIFHVLGKLWRWLFVRLCFVTCQAHWNWCSRHLPSQYEPESYSVVFLHTILEWSMLIEDSSTEVTYCLFDSDTMPARDLTKGIFFTVRVTSH